MSELKVMFPCVVEPALAVRRATRHLVREGYAISTRAADHVVLVFAKGAPASFSLHDARHLLELSSDGKRLLFVFTAGLVIEDSALGFERAELTRRAQLAVEAAHREEVEARVGCQLCGQLTESPGQLCARCEGAS